jgi:hypothetical protein
MVLFQKNKLSNYSPLIIDPVPLLPTAALEKLKKLLLRRTEEVTHVELSWNL